MEDCPRRDLRRRTVAEEGGLFAGKESGRVKIGGSATRKNPVQHRILYRSQQGPALVGANKHGGALFWSTGRDTLGQKAGGAAPGRLPFSICGGGS